MISSGHHGADGVYFLFVRFCLDYGVGNVYDTGLIVIEYVADL